MKISLALAATSACAVVATTLAGAVPGTQAAVPNNDKASFAAAARAQAQDRLNLSPGQDLQVAETLTRGAGTHVRFDRTYRGLEVVGGDMVVHQTDAGAFRSTTGRRLGKLALNTTPSVTAQSAARTAGRSVDFTKNTSSPELVVLAAHQAPTLTWRVTVEGRNADGSPAGEYVFVDAADGSIVDRWPSVMEESGTGEGLFVGSVPLETTNTGSGFSMVDPLRGGNATHNGPYSSNAPVFTDADNAWGNGTEADKATAGVDAHYGIASTWDYFKNTFGRNGIANDGKGARSFVHDGAYSNASWSDTCFCMRYGDGDTTTKPLVSLDIAGHEMSHGITSRSAKLIYSGESGGLNEATSDIFGTMVEFSANNAQDVPDYVVGEEIFRSYDPANNYVRRMDQPSADGASHDCWSRKTARVNVHYSSGPANHFFYLLAEGSGAKTINGVPHNSTTCDGSTITGIGRDKAAAIWYRALTTYMTSTTKYAGARVATINAANDLYGATSPEAAAVAKAWTAVNVA